MFMNAQELKLLSKSKDADALHQLACFHLNENNKKKDKELGEECLKLAASKGHIRALYDYGELLIEDSDFQQGVKHIKLAAKKKHGEAMFLLGQVYRGDFDNDITIYRNEQLSIKYFIETFKVSKGLAWEELLDLHPFQNIKDIVLLDSIIEMGMKQDFMQRI